MKRFLIPIIILVIITTVAFLHYRSKKTEAIHYHAGFMVFKDNAQVDFSDIKYMEVKPCGGDEHDEDEQIEKAHLHDGVGDVVHVHREGAKWTDLFTNIKYPIDYSTAKAYVNGTQLTNFQDLTIQPYDSVVVLIGENDTEAALSNAVTKTHIEETEKRSENCGS